ncbi:hypothetical protein T09_7883, partial [Trichinella sp. T9]
MEIFIPKFNCLFEVSSFIEILVKYINCEKTIQKISLKNLECCCNTSNFRVTNGTNANVTRNATVGDLRRVNKVYAQKQRQVARYTGEYT